MCAGVLNGLRCQGTPAADARIVFYGAGSSAVGVAETIAAAVAADAGIPVAQARTAIWMVDSKGLITTTRGDALAPHKVAFARTDGAPDMKQARGGGGGGGVCVGPGRRWVGARQPEHPPLSTIHRYQSYPCVPFNRSCKR